MSEFPENQPKDHNGSPLPTPLQVKEEAVREGRIKREQAQIDQGFASQPVAGHGEEHDDEHERGR